MSTADRAPVAEGESARLVAALAAGVDPPGLTVRALQPLPPGPPGPPVERPVTVDQTNQSVVVGERVVVKWLRAGVHARAPELLAHLAAVGFARTPTPYAAVYRSRALAALVTAFLPGALDGWDWYVDDLIAHVEAGRTDRLSTGTVFGTLAADLHAALATPSGVFPTPVRKLAGPGPALAAAALSTLDSARAAAESAGDAEGEWFVRSVPRLRAILEGLRGVADATPVIHPHGDLHVGQVLRWDDGYAIIDFDGNPVGPAVRAEDPVGWEPAARDVASLRMSVLHAAQIANRRTQGRQAARLLDIARAEADELLAAYRAGLARHDLAHLLDERLLAPFEVEQECRELVYAARFLPRWRYAPLGVLRSWTLRSRAPQA